MSADVSSSDALMTPLEIAVSSVYQFLKAGLAVLLFSLTLGANARADSSHRFYGGVGAGYSTVNDAIQGDPAAAFVADGIFHVPTGGYAYDDHDLSWSAFVGYRPLESVALEGGFRDLGRFESDSVVNFWSAPELRAEEWYLTVRWMTHIYKRLSLTAQLGATYASFHAGGEVRLVESNPPVVVRQDPSDWFSGGVPPPPLDGGVVATRLEYESPDDEAGWLWGIGLSYTLTDRIDLDLGYGRHENKVIDIETLDLELRFGF